jgi:hypothetical protein
MEEPRPAPARNPFDPYRLASFALVLVSTSLSLMYCWIGCPLDLSSDEAHYWEWSRRLDWSYYSKGPLIAWLIRASCEVFGAWSISETGDQAAAVRLPAVFCHAGILLGSYSLASGVFRTSRAGLLVVLGAASLPVVRVGSVLMTIDPPFLCCWCWAMYCVWKAISTRDRGLGWWVGAALFAAFGTLAKYTMVLFPVAIGAWLLCHHRRGFRRPGIWILFLGSLLGWFPVLVWNLGHDWVSFRHVAGQVAGGTTTETGIRWMGPVAYLGAQFGMLLGLWLCAFLAAAWRFRPWRTTDPGIQLLWWCSVPVWCLFGLVSLVKAGQPNWPAPAYIGAVILSVAWLRSHLEGAYRGWLRCCFGLCIPAGLVVSLAMHYPSAVRPTLARLVPGPTPERPLPIRGVDITARLVGWKHLAVEIDRLRLRCLAESGEAPVLAGSHWTIPGHLRFYCDGQPEAYSVGLPDQIDRHSQYDFWRPNPLKDAQEFQGRTFIIVGDLGANLRRAFDRIEPGIHIIHSEDGIPIAAWMVWVCHGFRGFPDSGLEGCERRY